MYADNVKLCRQYNELAQSLALQSDCTNCTLSGCELDRITYVDDLGIYRNELMLLVCSQHRIQRIAVGLSLFYL